MPSFELYFVNGKKAAVPSGDKIAMLLDLIRLCHRQLGPGTLVKIKDREYAWGQLASEPSITQKSVLPGE